MFINIRMKGNEYNKIVRKDCYNIQKIPSDSLDTIFDFGASIGIFSVMMKMRHSKAKVIAVEPLKSATKFIKRNVHAHGIYLEEKALGNGESFYLYERGHILDGIYSPIGEGEKVESIKLVDLFNQYQCKLTDRYLLKFNCEGGEKYLVGDKESEKVLYYAKYVTMQVHFKTLFTNFDSWLEHKDYLDWITKTFTHHKIENNHRYNKRGTSHYTITWID